MWSLYFEIFMDTIPYTLIQGPYPCIFSSDGIGMSLALGVISQYLSLQCIFPIFIIRHMDKMHSAMTHKHVHT